MCCSERVLQVHNTHAVRERKLASPNMELFPVNSERVSKAVDIDIALPFPLLSDSAEKVIKEKTFVDSLSHITKFRPQIIMDESFVGNCEIHPS